MAMKIATLDDYLAVLGRIMESESGVTEYQIWAEVCTMSRTTVHAVLLGLWRTHLIKSCIEDGEIAWSLGVYREVTGSLLADDGLRYYMAAAGATINMQGEVYWP